MSTWIVITESDLKRYIVDAQLKALLEAALGPGQENPFVETMHDVADYVISRISGRVQISATKYAVPPELRKATCLLTIEALVIRLAIGIQLSDDQQSMITRAYRDLDIAGTSALTISTADDSSTPSVQSDKAGISVVTKPSRVQSRDDYQGL